MSNLPTNKTGEGFIFKSKMQTEFICHIATFMFLKNCDFHNLSLHSTSFLEMLLKDTRTKFCLNYLFITV